MLLKNVEKKEDNTVVFQVEADKDEFEKAGSPIDLDTLLQRENPVWYLMEDCKLSGHGLETMIDILFHSDLDETRKHALLQDALAYLDGKGYYSFRLHSLSGG